MHIGQTTHWPSTHIGQTTHWPSSHSGQTTQCPGTPANTPCWNVSITSKQTDTDTVVRAVRYDTIQHSSVHEMICPHCVYEVDTLTASLPCWLAQRLWCNYTASSLTVDPKLDLKSVTHTRTQSATTIKISELDTSISFTNVNIQYWIFFIFVKNQLLLNKYQSLLTWELLKLIRILI